jgi:hypothetical protein
MSITQVSPRDASIAMAIKALTTTEKEKSWETNVTNHTGFEKIKGFVIHIWNLRATIAKDKAFAPTIADFKNKTVALVDAVAKRVVTAEEATELRLPSGKFILDRDGLRLRDLVGEKQVAAVTALNEFYAVFKKRVSQLNVTDNHKEFGAYAAAAQKMVLDHANTKEERNLLVTKLTSTEMQNFNSKILEDIGAGYADQSLDNINPASFKEKVDLISGYYKFLDQPTIEQVLRNAIIGKHTQETIEQAEDKFTNPSEGDEIFTNTKTLFKTKLETEQTALQAKYVELCGTDAEIAKLRQEFPDGNIQGGGTIHYAYTDEVAAENEVARVADELIALGSRNLTNLLPGALVDLPDDSTLVIAKKGELRTAMATRDTKRDAHAALKKQLGEIARHSNGVLSAGTLFVATERLKPENLNQVVRREMNKTALFYKEIFKPVTNENRDTLSGLLKVIINTDPRENFEQEVADRTNRTFKFSDGGNTRFTRQYTRSGVEIPDLTRQYTRSGT